MVTKGVIGVTVQPLFGNDCSWAFVNCGIYRSNHNNVTRILNRFKSFKIEGLRSDSELQVCLMLWNNTIKSENLPCSFGFLPSFS